nr:hypothetical protein [Sphingomonas rhizophila]
MVVPSPSLSEKQLRRAALRQARREFVATLSPGMRLQASADLSQVLRPLLEKATVVGGYHTVGSEIDPAPALHLAEQLGATIALPAFAGHGEPMLFRTGPADGIGPYAIAQSSGTRSGLTCCLSPSSPSTESAIAWAREAATMTARCRRFGRRVQD